MEQSFRNFSRSVRRMMPAGARGNSSMSDNRYLLYITLLIIVSLLIIAYILYYAYRVTNRLEERGDKLEAELKQIREKQEKERKEKKEREEREKKEREEKDMSKQQEREQQERERKEKERVQQQSAKKLIRYMGATVECEKLSPANCGKYPYGCCPDGYFAKMDSKGTNCGIGVEELKTAEFRRAMNECGYTYRYDGYGPYRKEEIPIFNIESRRIDYGTSIPPKTVKYFGMDIQCDSIAPADCGETPFGCCPDGYHAKNDQMGANCERAYQRLAIPEFRSAARQCGFGYRIPRSLSI